MLQFQHQNYLQLLFLVPLLIFLFVWALRWRKKMKSKLGDQRLIDEQLLGHIPGRNTLKFILQTLAMVCVILGLANLREPKGALQAERKGIDVMIALDVSKSMLATDVQPNRLEKAKQLILSLTDDLKDNRMGLVIFAGRAYLQMPVTTDFSAIKMMLQTVSPESVPSQGTVLADAIEMADESFSQKEKMFKTLILISDGEDHDERALAAAEKAAEHGVMIHTVGIGSPEGATLTDAQTGQPRLDKEGHQVISKLNEEELKNIAAAGKGTYTHLLNPKTASKNLMKETLELKKKNFGAFLYTDYQNYFQYFLGLGLLFLLIDLILPGSTRHIKTRSA